MTLLSIDPGSPGWHRAQGASGFATFDALTLALAGHGPPARIPGITEIAVEIPAVRRAGQSKGRPEDLIRLAIVAGRWIGMNAPSEVTEYAMSGQTWKGQLPKDVCHARARAVLTAAELALVPSLPKTRGRLDMWDAISLGLVHSGRLRMR